MKRSKVSMKIYLMSKICLQVDSYMRRPWSRDNHGTNNLIDPFPKSGGELRNPSHGRSTFTI